MDDRVHLIKKALNLPVSYDTKRALGVNDDYVRREAVQTLMAASHKDCHKCSFAHFETFNDITTMTSHYGVRCMSKRCEKAEWSLKNGPIIQPPKPPSEDELTWMIEETKRVNSPFASTDVPKVAEAGAW